MFCCDMMHDMIESGDIVVCDGVYKIFGQPAVDENTDTLEDITETFEINCCPFCGKDII